VNNEDNTLSPPQKHDPYTAMRQRNYRLYMLGNIFSMMGMRIQGIAVVWEVYNRTDDALALGLTALMEGLPMMILALPAGYLADAFNRRKVVILSAVNDDSSTIKSAYYNSTLALPFSK